MLQSNFREAYEIRRVCWFLFRVTKIVSDIEKIAESETFANFTNLAMIKMTLNIGAVASDLPNIDHISTNFPGPGPGDAIIQ